MRNRQVGTPTRMEQVNSDLIEMARKLRQITQSELARRVHVTQGHLSKVEQGLATAPAELVAAVAEATDLPQSFFYQGDDIYGLPFSVHPMFRKKQRVPKRTLDAIQAELNIRLMHLRRVLEAAELNPDLQLPHVDMDEDEDDAEEVAQLVRGTWLAPSGPIKNLVNYVERAGCLVVECDFANSDIDGVTISAPDLPPVIFVRRGQPGDRRRFTLAHELGHLIMHRQPHRNIEQQANDFAAALLMPAGDISFHLSRISLPRLAQLKPVWRVSMAALLMRARKLGRLTDNQARYLWRQMAPYRRREPPELDVVVERPGIVPAIARYHLDELGYSLDEFAQVLHTRPDELQRMYELGGGAHLRLVKS